MSTKPKPPARAPVPTVDRIEELAERILRADILLPKFQRDFVWGRQQILDMLDSIANNYPVGSVLLWRSSEQLRSERNIADLVISETAEGYPVNYLLDGQQRLSTVCGALYWNGTDPTSRWNLAYDLREGKFLHLETLDEPPQHQIRLNKLADASAYFQHATTLSTLKDADVLGTRHKELFDRFKDYKIATVTLHEMSIKAVAPIFERINSKGTPLTIVDLMRAATWSEDFDLIDSIQDILAELEKKDFGEIDRKAILRSISAASGGGFSEASIDQLRKHDSAKLKEAVGFTKTSYLRAVDYLSTDLHIPSATRIPYVNQLVVLAEVFRLLPNMSPERLKQITTWYWRTAISGYFSGWNTGNMAADQSAVADFAASKTKTIDNPSSDPGPAIWTAQQFRSNAAHAKILILLLCFREPVDLLTGQKIDVTNALHQGNTKEFHHFFPRDYLINKGVTPRRANLLANIIMLSSASNKLITNRAPSDYLKQVADHLGGSLEAVLDANLISIEAFEAGLKDDYDTFLALRSTRIHAAVSGLTGW